MSAAGNTGDVGAAVPPQLDVVLPTHNVAPWLAEALKSLQEQSFTNWHAYVVIDTCSDASEQIARGFAARDSRFTVHNASEPGVGRARNVGLALGTAPFVAFVDPDDVVPPGAFAQVIGSLQRSGSDLAAGMAVQFRDGPASWPYWTTTSGLFDRPIAATTLQNEPRLILDHTTWNKAYRRAFLTDNGIVFPETVSIGEDAHHTLEAICRAERIDVLSEVVYRHRIRPHSLTRVIRSDKSVGEWVVTTRLIKAIVDGVDQPDVTRIWRGRMLEQEAWTRARRVGSLESDATLDAFLSLIRDLIRALSQDEWDALPLLLRWGYEAVGAIPATHLRVHAVDLETELASCRAEIDSSVTLPEFTRFERELRISGTALRAHLWRESLLLPTLRLMDRQSAEQHRRAFARVLAFHDHFVTAHALLPGEAQILDLARAERFDELSAWANSDRALRAEAHIAAAGPNRITVSVRLKSDAAASAQRSIRIVASSLGAIAGITRDVSGRLALECADPDRITASIPSRSLLPRGRWALFARVESDDAVHYLPLAPATQPSALSSLGRLHSLRRLFGTLIRVSIPGANLVIESRGGFPSRAVRRLFRIPLVGAIWRRLRAKAGETATILKHRTAPHTERNHRCEKFHRHPA